MNERLAREKLQQILNTRINADILFSETKTVDGAGMVEGNIRWIKSHSEDSWDEKIAVERVTAMERSMEYHENR